MRRCVNKFIFVLLTVNILTGVTVISLILQRRSQLKTSSERVSQYKLRLDAEYDRTKKIIIGEKNPAAVVSHNLSPVSLSVLKPVAHLSGLQKVDVSNNGGMTRVRCWSQSEESERELLYNGMLYKDGVLTVSAKGTYMVYSNIKFYVNKSEHKQIKNFEHTIVKYQPSNMEGETVFRNEETECMDGINKDADVEYVSSQKGLVELNAGDSLAVMVTDHALILSDRDWQYFGAYLV